MHVIGTAGHVDHGKSTLVHALTGIDPDRLREEKEREMTIDLGFAWLELPNSEPVGIIDVPGHRDFIENMLAGVGGIDAVLLVVAADEGVMPQTKEHLAILDLLEVDKGIVVLTKADLAESEAWLELVSADVSETLDGTSLEGSPTISVSARTGQGLTELTVALQDMLAQVESRSDLGRPRLPVDRVFSISGFGTVVTGTLIDGVFEVGKEIEVQPRGLKGRIRGLQTHKQKSERAVPGSRLAMNISGIRKADLNRGHVVTYPGWLRPTLLVDVLLQYLPESRRPLRHNTQLKFFSGAAETIARVRLLGQEELPPGQVGWAQLQLRDPVALVNGDRFIVRLPSPPTTLGGGTVVDSYPGRKHRRFRQETVTRLETLVQGDPPEILLQSLARSGPTSARQLLASNNLGEIGIEALELLIDDDRVVPLGPSTGAGELATRTQLLATRSYWSDLVEQLSSELSGYHRKFPLRVGMPREALRSGLRLEAKLFSAVMLQAVTEGCVVEDSALVRLPSHAVSLAPDQLGRVEALLDRFRRQPYTPPSVKESAVAVGSEVLGVLINQGTLIQVSSGVLFLPETYEAVVKRIRAHIGREGHITLPQTRDMLRTSRKYAQAILEHLDDIGVTSRVGDQRVLQNV